MAEYIEVSSLWKCETCFYHQGGKCHPRVWCESGEAYRPDYRKLQFADVTPVVHGRWEHHENGVAYCSECEMDAVEDGTDYCPNCGAKMEAKNDE